jgi:hypothetical protein
MTKIKSTDVKEAIKNRSKVLIAFIDSNSLLSISTLKILRDIKESATAQIFYVDVEESRESISDYSLRIIPTIHLYESGILTKKLILPYSKEDLECLIQ